MSKYGLLGEHLGHSYSPQIHKMLGGYDYELFEVSPDKLGDFLGGAVFDGINVTIPYKKAVIPFCAELSPEAEKIGSVNTVIRLPDGSLRGDNTDYHGFRALVERSGVSVTGRKCVVLGNGGVAPTVRAVLTDLGAAGIVTVSRSGENNYVNLSRHSDAEIIVNTTPVGMFPNNGESAVDITLFKSCVGVFDVIYNPARTKLLLDAESAGVPAFGGLYMLVAQAKRACELFLNTEVGAGAAEAAYEKIASQMLNVAVIGMPGCGKSSVGAELARLTGREFIDIDAQIVKRIGGPIPEFFAANGEDAFRSLETEVLAEFAKKSGLIIATGGGVVTRAENYPLLHQNSTVVFRQRPICELPKDGRPVSLANPLEKLAAERMPLYNSWCDLAVAGSSAAEAAGMIKEALKL